MSASTSPDTTDRARSGVIRDPRRFRSRLLAWLGGAVAAAVVWLVATQLAGDEMLTTAPGRATMAVGLVPTVVAALVVGGLGWALLSLLERLLTRGRTIWLVIAVVVLVLSGVNAATAADDTATAVWLNVMHVAVFAVLGPILTSTSSRR